MAGHVLTSPMFIKAKTLEGLTRAMLANNIKYGMQFTYFNISKLGKEYVAWYNHNFETYQIPGIVETLK